MKLVKFKKITVQNFLSVGEEPVVINFTKGLNIITGINKDKSSRRNGVVNQQSRMLYILQYSGTHYVILKKRI